MTPDNITELIYRYLTGKATDKEISIIADYLHDFPEERDSFAETALIYSCMKTLGSRDIGTMQDRMLARLNARIDAGDDVTATGHEPGMDAAGAEGQTAGAVLTSGQKAAHEPGHRKRDRHGKNVFLRTISSAAAVAAVIASIFTITLLTEDKEDILYTNTGTSCRQIVLPDSSSVLLQPGAGLTWKASRKKDSRISELHGSAYFDVRPCAESPFAVRTEKLTVKVTGTTFAIEENPEDRTVSVILETGAVTVQNPDGVGLVRLVPGQKAVMHTDSEDITVEETNSYAYMIRHYNRVSLHLVTIEEILSNISSTYGVRIEADIQDSQRDKLYNINYDRTDTVEEVIAIIESLTGAELEIIDGTPGHGDAIE